MNKSIYIFFIALISVSLTFTSCKDDDVVVDPPADPVVSFDFSSPASGTMFGKGDTIFIKGTISYETTMHGYELSIFNVSQNDTMVFNKHEHMDAKTFNIDEYWINNVDHHSDMKLRIDAVKDHMGTTETKEISFHCHPM